MNNVSVFGGSGFIGSRFCEMYREKTIKLDRNDYVPKSNEILYLISTIDNYNIHTDLHKDVDTNLTVLLNVLENIDRGNKDVVFNFVSSWFVYGKNEVMPFNEEKSICNPTGFYSITKRCAEQMLISFCETFDVKYRIFRLANVLGEGDLKVSRKKNAAQYLIKQAVEGGELPLYNGGNAIRDYIYVDDVCRAIEHCIDNAPTNEIINVGSGLPCKLLDVVKIAMRETNSKSSLLQIDPPHFHKIVQVEHSYLDVSKLYSYGFQNLYDIETTVKKLVNHYQKI